MFSCGAFSFRTPTKANALTETNLGTLTLSLHLGNAWYTRGIYVTCEESVDFPNAGWEDNSKFAPTTQDAVIRNGVNIGSSSLKFVRVEPKTYFLALCDGGFDSDKREVDEHIIVQGTWEITLGDVKYSLSINQFAATWNGSGWKEEFIMPELETYNNVSLRQAGIPDVDCVAFDYETNPSCWNTFTLIEGNEHNNFSFEFAFESFSDMTQTLTVRIGSSGVWGAGHAYQLDLKNATDWGAGQGAMVFSEKQGDSVLFSQQNISCNLRPGARHIIKFGSITLKNDTSKVYNFVKYDDEYLFQKVRTASNSGLTTYVGFYYVGNNVIYLGNTIESGANTDVMTFNRGSGANGIYLDGPINEIPYDGQNWTVRGAPASADNVLRNGQPLFTTYRHSNPPLVKFGETDYYLSFADYELTFEEGDVIYFNGEFHFYEEGKAYTMAIVPMYFLYTNGTFQLIENIYTHLLGVLNNHCELDDYDDDKIVVINGILEHASNNLSSYTDAKELWNAYLDYVDQLDAVPLNEEKALARLNAAKQNAINSLNNYVDLDLYFEEEQTVITGLIESATADITAATSVAEVNSLLASAKASIDAVKSKQTVVEETILARKSGYEEYLKAYDVATTTDLCASSEEHIYAKNSANQSYSTNGEIAVIDTRLPFNSENPDGNMIFQFKYQSTDPSSSRYGSQMFIRLRGTATTNYRFSIGTDVGGNSGVSVCGFVNDHEVADSQKSCDANLKANKEYTIKCGAIDLKDYNRVFLFIEGDAIGEDDDFLLTHIIDKLDFETTPTVIIMDSYLADDSEGVTTITPFEDGTTKANNSTLVGRPVLDNESSINSLSFTLRSNNIPTNGTLYAIEETAITLNGQPINKTVVPAIKKTSPTKYSIILTGLTINDGDIVKITGCFAYYDTDEFVKTAYRLFDGIFTYHASTDSWSQEEPTVDVAIYEAKLTLQNYAVLSNYSQENQNRINQIVEEYLPQLENASTLEAIDTLLTTAFGLIDAVPTLLDEYKEAAKQEVASYKSASDYRQEEQSELAAIIAKASADIDGCSDKASVDIIVATAKDEMDALKTSSERDAEDLASYRKTIDTEIQTFVGGLDFSQYSDENLARIQNLAKEARSQVKTATSKEELDNILATLKQTVNGIEKIDGSTNQDTEEEGNNNEKPAKKGCKSSVIAVNLVISVASLIGFALMSYKKKNDND